METETEDQFVEDVQQEPGAEPATPAGAEPTTKAQPGDFDAALDKLGSRLEQTLGKKDEPQQKQLSPEQEKELWAIYDPEATNKDFMRKFFRLNPDATPEEVKEAKDLFADMQKGLVRQAVVGSRNLYTQEIAKIKKEFEDRYAPLETFYREQRANNLQKDFNSAYPALAVQNEDGSFRYAKAIRIAAADLAQTKFADQNSYFKALAEGAAAVVKGILPEFDLGAKTNETKPSRQTPSLPRTRVGGTGGTAGSGGSTQPNRGAGGDDASTLDWTAQT